MEFDYYPLGFLRGYNAVLDTLPAQCERHLCNQLLTMRDAACSRLHFADNFTHEDRFTCTSCHNRHDVKNVRFMPRGVSTVFNIYLEIAKQVTPLVAAVDGAVSFGEYSFVVK